MRISDWSSDVCSSDLDMIAGAGIGVPAPAEVAAVEDIDIVDRKGERAAVLRLGHRQGESAVAEEGRLAPGPRQPIPALGRASCRERGCQYVSTSGGAVTLQKNSNTNTKRQIDS